MVAPSGETAVCRTSVVYLWWPRTVHREWVRTTVKPVSGWPTPEWMSKSGFLTEGKPRVGLDHLQLREPTQLQQVVHASRDHPVTQQAEAGAESHVPVHAGVAQEGHTGAGGQLHSRSTLPPLSDSSRAGRRGRNFTSFTA